MNPRTPLIIGGAVVLAILGSVAVAAASTPSGGSGGPDGPSDEDCAQAQAELNALKSQRAGLNDQLISLQEAALMAGQAGDPAASQYAAQANAVSGQIAQVDSAIAELESLISEECQS